MSELVKNAASTKQVRSAGDKEKRRREAQLEDIRRILSSYEGRRLIHRILLKCGTFESVHHPSGSQVYYNSGQQDIGHFLMKEIRAADEQILFNIFKEEKDYDNV